MLESTLIRNFTTKKIVLRRLGCLKELHSYLVYELG